MTNMIIDSYGISVELSMHEPIVMSESETLKKFFTRRIEKEIDCTWRKNFERARNLVEYAESCGGKVKKISNHGSKTTFTFEFNELEMLLNFARSLRSYIEGA
ncbi:hypothetical protein IKG41_02120 [Candidatus Saccharibacteria bacterium]|nr:hypothetical protein [Candidatus Saccharibacteria bacterium]